jgi:hypothetical protein
MNDTQLAQPTRHPARTIEAGAHLGAAAYLIKHFHGSALVVTTDSTHQRVTMTTDADITQAIAAGRDPHLADLRGAAPAAGGGEGR